MSLRWRPLLLGLVAMLPVPLIAERISISSPGVREGQQGTTVQLEYVISRESSGAPLSLPYGWLAGVATAGTDFTEPPPGVLEFAAGESQKSVAATVIGDNVSEPDEAVRLHLPESGNLYIDGDWRESATVTPAGSLFPLSATISDELAVVASRLPSGLGAPLQAWRRAHGAVGKWISISPPAFTHPEPLEEIWRVALSGHTLFSQRNESRTLASPGTIFFVHDWLPESNAWVLHSSLRMPYYDGSFQFKMVADGDTLAVIPGPLAWIYRRDAGGAGTWHHEATLELPLQLRPFGSVTPTVLLRGDQLLFHDLVYATVGTGAHFFPWQRNGTTWTASTPFRTIANPEDITPLFYDGADLVMVTDVQIQRHRRDTGGPGAWGIVAMAPLADYSGSFRYFAWDNGDVLYAGQPDWPHPFQEIFRHRGTADGGWQSAESTWTGTGLNLMHVSRGAMFLHNAAWELRERTSAAGVIQDDDVVIFASGVTTVEPSDAPEATVLVPITLNLRKTLPVTVAWTLESAEAAAGADFVAGKGTVTIPAGDVTAEVPVTILRDGEFDSWETFRLVLTPVAFGLVGNPAVITVMDTSLPQGLTISSPTVTEGDSGAIPAPVNFLLASPLPAALTLSYRWQGAADARDFTSPASPFIIPAGETSAVLPVSVTGDLTTEMPFERAVLSFLRDAGPPPAKGWQVGEQIGGTFRTFEPTLIKDMDAGDGLVAFLYDSTGIGGGGITRTLRLLQRNAGGSYTQVLNSGIGRLFEDVVRQSGGRTVFVSRTGIINNGEVPQILKSEKGASWPVPAVFLTSVIGMRTFESFDADAETFVAGGGGERRFVEIRRRNLGGANGWGVIAELHQASSQHGNFGDAVAVSGDWLAISGNDGTVLMHHRHAGGRDRWGFVQEVSPPFSILQSRMRMDGDTLAVTNTSGGPVAIFRRQPEPAVNPWQLEAAVPSVTHFSLDGDLLAINADSVDRIHYRNAGGAGQWGELQRIQTDSTAPHYFHGPVAFDGVALFVASSGTAVSRFVPADAVLEITDDDPQPFITMPATATVRERSGQGLVFSVTFQLTNTGPNGTFNYEVIPGTALPDRDYSVPATLTGSLVSGNTSGDAGVTGLNDVIPEYDETFTLRITSATGKILAGTTMVTILDDDFDLSRARPVLSAGAAMRYQVAGTAAWNPAWFQPAYDDSSWTTGLMGAGFEAGTPNTPSFVPFIATNLQSAMHNQRTGALFRIPFQSVTPRGQGKYFLRMRNDDGFVAWINGQEIARSAAPSALSPASAALSPINGTWRESSHPIHSSAIPDAGASLLSVHGLNNFAADSDFLVLPEILFNDLPPQAWLDWISAAAPRTPHYHPADDSDSDGVVNAAEYVLGLDPGLPDHPADSLLAASLQGDGTRRITALLPGALPARARIEIEFTTTPAGDPWTTGATLDAAGNWSGPWTPSAVAPGPLGWRYQSFTPSAGNFFRVRFVTGFE